MKNPQYVKVKDKKYKINSDFRVAIKCDEIARDNNIDDVERALAIIYMLFGEDGLNSYEDWSQLIILALRYLSLDKNKKALKTDFQKRDFDYIQDQPYIRTSFIQDYGYNPYEMEYLHWWDFWNDLNGLSNSEFGNCCILNRIRNLRNYDVSKIKDMKERQKIITAKELVSLNDEFDNVKEVNYTEQEKNSINKFYEEIGLKRKEE